MSILGFLQSSGVTRQNVSNPAPAQLANSMLSGNQYTNSTIQSTMNAAASSGIQVSDSIPSGVYSALGVKTNTQGSGGIFGGLTDAINKGSGELQHLIKEGLGDIQSGLASLFGENQGKTGKSSVSQLLGSNAYQKGFMGSVSQGFQDGWSSIKNATALKTETPDPISSAYAKTQKAPTSTLLVLKNGVTGMKADTVGSGTPQSSNYITGNISTLAQRYGSDIVGGSNFDFKSAGNTLLKSNMLSGMFSNIGGAVGTVGSASRGLLGAFSGGLSGIAGALGTGLTGISSTFKSYVGNISQQIFGSTGAMNGYYNSSLPSMADYNGNPVPGYGNGGYLGYAGCEGLAGALGGMGCNTNWDAFSSIPYSALGSAMNAFQDLAAESGLTGLLGDIIECKNMTKYNFENLKNIFYNYAGSDINVSQLCMGNLGLYNIGQLAPGGGGGGLSGLGLVEESTPLTPDQALDKSGLTSNLALLKVMVLNPNLESSQMSTLKSVISNLGWEYYQAYTTGETVGDEPIWDSSTINSSLSDVTVSLLDDYEDVAYMSGGVEIKIN